MATTDIPTVVLPDDVIDEVCTLISTVQDWLLHTSDDVVGELAEFTNCNPQRFIDALGDTAVMLHSWERS
jgi:hypothetical protein